MKIIYKISFSLIVLVLSSTSCKKIIDEDINNNPNNPVDVPMNLLIPSAQAGMAFSFGSDLGRFPSLFIQSYAGLNNQHLLFDQYALTESDVNNMWFYNMYGNAMSNLKVVMDKAVALNSPHYGGVAKVLMANSLGVMSDLWGDIPYSEAFKGIDNLTPVFDTQEQIYETIQSLLTSAIADFSATSVLSPGADDLIYGGDLGSWRKAAYSLSARYWLHLGKKLGNVAYTNAIAAIDSGAFTDNSSNMQFNFGINATAASPIFQFFYDARPGDAGMGKFLIDLLQSTVDPRIDPIAELETNNDTDYYYLGAPAGVGENNDSTTSNVGLFYGSNNSPVLFINYAEVKFIRAEAQFQLGNTAEAATNCNEGVLASLAYFGVTGDSTFLANNASESGASITLSKIISQKYIANFTLGYEQWTDWRRTNLPVLVLADDAATTEIPRRFPYPNSERLYNGANMSTASSRQGGSSLTNRVWWDN